MSLQHLVIITSVIHFKPSKLSYAATRSVFSPEERITQTMATITSIKKYMPEAYILLLEMGTQNALPKQLIEQTSEYRYIGNDPIVRIACDSTHKGLGEAVGLLKGTKKLPQARMYLKISGRYTLTPTFDPALWDKKGVIARIHDNAFSTRLYGVSADAVPAWRHALRASLPWLFLGIGIEQMLLRTIPKKIITRISVLGIEGTIAPNGTSIEE